MLTGVTADVVAAVLLAAVLLFAVVQPRGLPEATLAVPAAALVVGLGIIGPEDALDNLSRLGPTVGFLAAILVLAHLADLAGVFDWLGERLAAVSAGQPVRLLGLVFASAAITTATLGLDATVVLLTPVVFRIAVRLGLVAKPHVYACTHLANSGSVLLPVSNLTNLLAFAASGLSFLTFAALMSLPWLAVIAVEYVVFRWFFRADLHHGPAQVTAPAQGTAPAEGLAPPRQATAVGESSRPTFALVVLSLTLVGFAASGLVDIKPLWVAVVGAAVLAARALVRGQIGLPGLVREMSPLFCLFVFALGVVVAGVTAHGLGRALTGVLPSTPSLMGLLAIAAMSAVLANLMNNLPATLAILAALGGAAHPGLVLAMLLGVNIGPNMTYVGSLGTLLWRRVLAREDAAPTLKEFLRLGALTVPATLVVGVLALWLGLTAAQEWFL